MSTSLSRGRATPRLVNDRTRCDGHAPCAELLPELLALDEWGFPISLTGERDPMLSTAPVDHGRRAVRACH